jgi:hypothetical protein
MNKNKNKSIILLTPNCIKHNSGSNCTMFIVAGRKTKICILSRPFSRDAMSEKNINQNKFNFFYITFHNHSTLTTD